MRVALEDGRAVRAADAKGPCWDLNNALRASVKPGHTTSDTNLVCSCLVAFCCQLCRGWLGSGSSSVGRRDSDCSAQEGTANPASSTNSLHSLAACKQGTPPTSKCVIIDSAMNRVSLPHHAQRVCPAGKMGAKQSAVLTPEGHTVNG